MSKSRLEKFLYALYSLDSSDLPKPLSRIEELYSCLVTGDEVPTFEPLSRVEKYLMAILGVYDVDSLPNPISRVEVLLYKLAIGDDNLDDVKSFLSEHEELLAEIIRNGGVGGDIDIEYVLHTLSSRYSTLYNTAKKTVKSAILKGNSEVVVGKNKCNMKKIESGWVDGNTGIVNTTSVGVSIPVEVSGTITISNYIHASYRYVYEYDVDGNYLGRTQVTTDTVTLVLNENTTSIRIGFYQAFASDVESLKLQVEQGEIATEYEPYNQTLVSVQMPVLTTTGKNLIDETKLIDGYLTDTNKLNAPDAYNKITDYIKIKPNTKYIYQHGGFVVPSDIESRYRTYWTGGYFYDKDKRPIGGRFKYENTLTAELTSPSNAQYVRLGSRFLSVPGAFAQLEESSIATSYEPYKSNILTVNEDVTLRGIGDVRDELNCLTGEVVQRVGEIILNGVENWGADKEFTNTYRFYLEINDMINRNWTTVICNPPFVKSNTFRSLDLRTEAHYLDTEHLTGWDFSKIILNISKERLSEFSVDALKTYIQKNPITVQYQLATESVKTVDLSVVNQDGNNTKLSTFDDITHVTLSSEGLIPEAELEVATKNEEDLEDSIVYTTHTLSKECNTLYNTAKKPIKSAILKGQTLVNNLKEISLPVQSTSVGNFDIPIITKINKGERYYAYIDIEVPSGATRNLIGFLGSGDWQSYAPSFKSGINKIGLDAKSDLTEKLRIQADNGTILKSVVLMKEDVEFIDQFWGMKSVQMPVLKTTGKNLFDKTKAIRGYIANASGILTVSSNNGTSDYIKVESGKTYVRNVSGFIAIYDSNKNFIKQTPTSMAKFNADTDGYIRWNIGAFDDILDTIQVEEGSTATEYEPYKSNILTVNEEVELRGIGEVQDELNLLTGELTQRIDEIVLNGSEEWTLYEHNMPSVIGFYTSVALPNVLPALSDSQRRMVLSDAFIFKNQTLTNDEEFIFISNTGKLNLNIERSKLSDINLTSFKSYLASNPFTVQYQLATESVKTVDLSVVNQDGNNTKLSTFNDITHVTLSSEGLIPEAELEVAEKVTEVAASMLTISREQEVINATTNEQSENVDATMIATTEIYEELL